MQTWTWIRKQCWSFNSRLENMITRWKFQRPFRRWMFCCNLRKSTNSILSQSIFSWLIQALQHIWSMISKNLPYTLEQVVIFGMLQNTGDLTMIINSRIMGSCRGLWKTKSWYWWTPYSRIYWGTWNHSWIWSGFKTSTKQQWNTPSQHTYWTRSFFRKYNNSNLLHLHYPNPD
jgi:hypothetical protein